MNKRVIGIMLAIIVVIVGFLWLTKPKTETATSKTPASNHIQGKGAKGVTLIEYGDFQCPACGLYYPVVKSVYEKYQNDIYFQFINYPLEALHQNARASARAAEAASLQGRFWEMYDALYQDQKSWETASDPLSVFTQYANQIGVTDIAKFTTDYKSSAVNDTINADLQAGQKFSITGTPTFFIDGTKLNQNPATAEEFNKLIDDAIAKKSSVK